jgi:hypothetical protein
MADSKLVDDVIFDADRAPCNLPSDVPWPAWRLLDEESGGQFRRCDISEDRHAPRSVD